MTNTANREVCDCVFLDYKTKKPVLFIDYANTTTQEITGNTVFAYGGKGHPKRVAFQGEKEGTITIETQLRSFELYSFLTGAGIQETAKYIKREKLIVKNGCVALSESPVDGTVDVFSQNSDCKDALKCTVNGCVVTVDNAKDGDIVFVYYWTEKNAGVKSLNIKATTFPGDFIFQGDTYEKAENGDVTPYLYIAHKCSPQPTFSLSQANTGDPATLTITCDLMVDEDGNMLTLIAIEDGNAIDPDVASGVTVATHSRGSYDALYDDADVGGFLSDKGNYADGVFTLPLTTFATVEKDIDDMKGVNPPMTSFVGEENKVLYGIKVPLAVGTVRYNVSVDGEFLSDVDATVGDASQPMNGVGVDCYDNDLVIYCSIARTNDTSNAATGIMSWSPVFPSEKEFVVKMVDAAGNATYSGFTVVRK